MRPADCLLLVGCVSGTPDGKTQAQLCGNLPVTYRVMCKVILLKQRAVQAAGTRQAFLLHFLDLHTAPQIVPAHHSQRNTVAASHRKLPSLQQSHALQLHDCRLSCLLAPHHTNRSACVKRPCMKLVSAQWQPGCGSSKKGDERVPKWRDLHQMP